MYIKTQSPSFALWPYLSPRAKAQEKSIPSNLIIPSPSIFRALTEHDVLRRLLHRPRARRLAARLRDDTARPAHLRGAPARGPRAEGGGGLHPGHVRLGVRQQYRLLCDAYAEKGGFLVYLPDFMGGELGSVSLVDDKYNFELRHAGRGIALLRLRLAGFGGGGGLLAGVFGLWG